MTQEPERDLLRSERDFASFRAFTFTKFHWNRTSNGQDMPWNVKTRLGKDGGKNWTKTQKIASEHECDLSKKCWNCHHRCSFHMHQVSSKSAKGWLRYAVECERRMGKPCRKGETKPPICIRDNVPTEVSGILYEHSCFFIADSNPRTILALLFLCDKLSQLYWDICEISPILIPLLGLPTTLQGCVGFS